MSLQPGVPSQSAANNPSTSVDNAAADSGIELLEEPAATQLRDISEDMYWVANSDSSEPVGPISSIEVRKQLASGAIPPNAFVWRNGMSQWARIHNIFDVSRPMSSGPEALPQPPPLVMSNSLTAAEIFNFAWTWNPPAAAFRRLARIALAFGVLTIILSLILAPFGKSWFSGGLQAILIAAVLELAAVVRATVPPNNGAVSQDMKKDRTQL